MLRCNRTTCHFLHSRKKKIGEYWGPKTNFNKNSQFYVCGVHAESKRIHTSLFFTVSFLEKVRPTHLSNDFFQFSQCLQVPLLLSFFLQFLMSVSKFHRYMKAFPGHISSSAHDESLLFTLFLMAFTSAHHCATTCKQKYIGLQS